MSRKINIQEFESIKRGDIKSFETLFRAYYKPLLIYSQQILKNREDANEIVQDVFLKLWEKRKRIEIRTSINSYLYRSVYNNSIQMLKRKKLDLNYKEYKTRNSNKFSITPDDEMVAAELNHKIGILLEDLPENCKRIFKMNRFEGMKYREISEQLSISIKTVEASMSKALLFFREHLAEYVVPSRKR